METLIGKKVTLEETILKTLSQKEKVRLLTGMGAWHTFDCNGKLPSIMMTDGPHGLRKQENEAVGQNNLSKMATCFPTESAIACSWDTEAAFKLGAAIGEEALSEKVSVVLGCGVNIKRSPLCGRNFEYFSEDPFLAGKMAAGYIKGVQSKGIGTSLKHFAGNNQETHRQTSNSQIDERALREIYLQAFEIAVKEAQPATVMASYNRLNGEYACENRKLLTDILRDEWGFKGTIISDWGAAIDMVSCIKAGLDLEMPDSKGVHSSHVLKALEDGRLTEKELDRAVLKVIGLVMSQASKLKDVSIDYENHHNISKDLECESAVLLKNNGFLPLYEESEVLIVGEMAEHMRFQGGGSSHVTTRDTANVIESLKKLGVKVTYAKGYHEDNDTPDENLEAESLRLAKTGIKILFFGGLTEKFEGEGYDRKNLHMPMNQTRLFNKLYEVNNNIAFIAFGGSPMKITFASKAKAILHMYLGGQAVGEACADLITGRVNPSGKLAETFPCSLEEIPSYEYFGRESDDVEYRESLFVGYRYYDTYNKPVQFAFGHGLSYTTFEYSDIKLSTDNFIRGTMEVTFKLKNTGSRKGKEVAQIYIQNPKCNYLRPLKELRGFKKVLIEPGEQKEITIKLEERSFSIYDEDRKEFIMPKGNYKILVASSSDDIRLKSEVHVEGVEYLRDDRKLLHEYFHQNGENFKISRELFEKLYGRELSNLDGRKKGEFTVKNSLEQLAKHSLLGKIMVVFAKIEALKINKGKRKDDPEVMMLMRGIMEGTIDSVIFQSGGIIPYKVAEAMVFSANGHHIKAVLKLIRKEPLYE